MVAAEEHVDDGAENDLELLTAEGGALKTTPALREKIAIYRSGLCLVARTHADDHDVISAIALARRLGHEIYPPKYVDLGAIRTAYAANEAPDKNAESEAIADTQMKKEFMGILKMAAKAETSDVHLVVNRGEAMVYFRVNGEREPQLERPWPANYGHQMCRTAYATADVADASYEQFAYQAARISTNLPEPLQAIRLQFNPVGFDGRQMILRLLYSKSSAGVTLDGLGFTEDHQEKLTRIRKEPVGIVVVSGPTGSGKSTTLERLMRVMVRENPGDHILSVEDPPEYLMPGVVQLPVSNVKTDSEREAAFSEAIAAAMRSDPDRLMIGEVRTKASAELAFRGALTGHALYTTLHSNSALGIVSRFLDIGVSDYMVRDPTLVKGMTAQRLLRKLCDNCKVETKLDDLAGGLGDRIRANIEGIGDTCFVGGPGCEHCREGYTGRTIIAEIIIPDQPLLQLACDGLKVEAEAYWKEILGGKDMKDHAMMKIRDGICDPYEVEKKLGRLGG